jgi:phosphoribosylanthranilate isomerase
MSAASHLWIKICANTTLEDAQLAAEAGADAVGFVFAPSPRRVTTAHVAAITPHLPASLEKIGVFVDAAWDEICATVRDCGLTGVQLHSEAEPGVTAQLRESFGTELRILRVVHFGPGAADHAAAIMADENVDAILVDSRTATAVGGTGVAFDWAMARETLFGSPEARLVAAGGLTPHNVVEAIATLRPWGVDVASGVEMAPGRKDPRKVRDFIANARAGTGASCGIPEGRGIG